MIACYGHKQVVIDQSLSAKSERWEAKTKKNRLGMDWSDFGPFIITGLSKFDSLTLKIKSDQFPDIHLFEHDATKDKRKGYSITICRNTDTATVLFVVWFRSKTWKPGLFSKKDSNPVSDTKDASGRITINNDPVSWIFDVNTYGIKALLSEDIYKKTSGYLVYGQDTIYIEPIGDFTDGRPGFGGLATKGIVLKNNKNESVAALQMVGNRYLWIRKDLPGNTQLAIAAVFAMIFSSKDQ